jgi:[ribosomal protein S5]-alanine N-acetyltransferase
MKLVEIGINGASPANPGPLPEVARTAVASTVQLYARAGWNPPWIGYLAFEGSACVGTCAFTSPPVKGTVEIAYFTFPGHEGRGVATRMAERLVSISLSHSPDVSVTAHTLPEENASTRILRKVGFVHVGAVVHPEDGQIWVWRHSTQRASIAEPSGPAPA